MNDLVSNLAILIGLKCLNRDRLAQAIGLTRPNFLSALKARRQLPAKRLPKLRDELGLADTYKFTSEKIHGLTIKNGIAQKQALYTILTCFCSLPFCKYWRLHGIGEDGKEGVAIMLKDSSGSFICIRNDDFMLFNMQDVEPRLKSDMQTLCFDDIFKNFLTLPEIEIKYDLFCEFMGNTYSSAVFEKIIASPMSKIWTWDRLRTYAVQKNISPEIIASQMNFFD